MNTIQIEPNLLDCQILCFEQPTGTKELLVKLLVQAGILERNGAANTLNDEEFNHVVKKFPSYQEELVKDVDRLAKEKIASVLSKEVDNNHRLNVTGKPAFQLALLIHLMAQRQFEKKGELETSYSLKNRALTPSKVYPYDQVLSTSRCLSIPAIALLIISISGCLIAGIVAGVCVNSDRYCDPESKYNQMTTISYSCQLSSCQHRIGYTHCTYRQGTCFVSACTDPDTGLYSNVLLKAGSCYKPAWITSAAFAGGIFLSLIDKPARAGVNWLVTGVKNLREKTITSFVYNRDLVKCQRLQSQIESLERASTQLKILANHIWGKDQEEI